MAVVCHHTSCQRQGLCRKGKKVSRPQKLELNFDEESPETGRPLIDSDFAFY